MSLLLLMKISWIYVFESSLITYNKSIYRFCQSFIIGTQAIAIACIIIRLRIRFHITHFRTKSRSERKRNVGIFFFLNKWLNALISHTNWLLLSGLLMKQYIYWKCRSCSWNANDRNWCGEKPYATLCCIFPFLFGFAMKFNTKSICFINSVYKFVCLNPLCETCEPFKYDMYQRI